MIQTAEGATQEITVMLQRMSELAVQASNSTYSDEQRGYLDQEFQQLKQEIVRISDTHEWNGFPILNGKAGTPVGAPKIETVPRAGVTSTSVGKALLAGDVEIQTKNGSFAIPASMSSSDSKSSALAFSSDKAGSAIAIAAAINSKVGETGVNATVNSAVISANKTTVGTTSVQTDLYVNGEKVSLSLSAGQTLGERRQYVMESINAGTAVHGVTAGDGGAGGLTLKTIDGRNMSVWYDSTSVQGSDFGLGLDTATASNPPGVTGILGTAGVTAGSIETSNLTFTSLSAGENFTVNGLTFTANTTTTATQVAAAFSNLKSGMTAVAATAANPNSAALGKFSGVFAEGFTTGANDGAKLVATATSKGNVGDITVGGTTKPAVLTTSGGVSATAPTKVNATPGTSGTAQVDTITFTALEVGQSVSVDGLTFSANVALTAAQVASKFASLAKSTSGVSGADGVWSGALSANWSTGSATSGSAAISFTADVASASTPAITTSSVKAETSVITFPDLKKGQSYTVAGLTFTAAADMADTAVAAAFQSVSDDGVGSAVSSVGTYTGKMTGFRTTVASTNTVTAIATATTNVTDIKVSQPNYPIVTTSAGQTVAASTVYGTVTLTSNEPFTIKPGANAYAQGATPAVDPTYSNFTALGFEAKTINPKNIGRLSFQVGPAENQLITIDMADFGPNGDITGPITSVNAPTNIRTVQSSNDVIMNVNKSLDRIAETRATMGAVMNRLEHVIDNLTSVVMNSEASRSQIEDADYAQASTELARTQIMQQAATAVLAQANTSQQTVLKLLQG
jgi:flagellin